MCSGSILGHADNQGLQLWVDLRSSWWLALLGAVKLLGHERAMPAENGIGRDHLGDFFQGLLAQLLADCGQGLALAIRSAHTARDLVAEDAMLRDQICVTQQQFLIDGPRDVCQQGLPIHVSVPSTISS